MGQYREAAIFALKERYKLTDEEAAVVMDKGGEACREAVNAFIAVTETVTDPKVSLVVHILGAQYLITKFEDAVKGAMESLEG